MNHPLKILSDFTYNKIVNSKYSVLRPKRNVAIFIYVKVRALTEAVNILAVNKYAYGASALALIHHYGKLYGCALVSLVQVLHKLIVLKIGHLIAVRCKEARSKVNVVIP